RIRGAREAMATRWDIAPDDIGLIKTYENRGGPSGDASKAVVVYLGDIGLKMGSYAEIMDPANDAEYILDVGDRSYDARRGMTRTAYLGLWLGSPEGGPSQPFSGFGTGIDGEECVSQIKYAPAPWLDNIRRVWDRGFYRIPDVAEPAVYRQFGTLLTGEGLNAEGAFSYGYTGGPSVAPEFGEMVSGADMEPKNRYGSIREYDLRFRPAVVIE
ncbi:MAG TPA: hypothetical protein VHA37_03790, partial [Candidatus Saccharimonadales bacterium]|nr:hypothetical protein [Candidatus Saccharimonadales bacterium]